MCTQGLNSGTTTTFLVEQKEVDTSIRKLVNAGVKTTAELRQVKEESPHLWEFLQHQPLQQWCPGRQHLPAQHEVDKGQQPSLQHLYPDLQHPSPQHVPKSGQQPVLQHVFPDGQHLRAEQH
ncbi:hypothetical protein TNCV_3766811 [Trichonephila clavipes]|nr:hypothetical protein TNCV_3766811 [Trichonephila clavipes]